MRRVFTTLMYSLMLLLGSAMVFSEGGKKDDKKDGKKDKGHQPVVIVIYLPAWSPVIREATLPNLVVPVEDYNEVL